MPRQQDSGLNITDHSLGADDLALEATEVLTRDADGSIASWRRSWTEEGVPHRLEGQVLTRVANGPAAGAVSTWEERYYEAGQLERTATMARTYDAAGNFVSEVPNVT